MSFSIGYSLHILFQAPVLRGCWIVVESQGPWLYQWRLDAWSSIQKYDFKPPRSCCCCWGSPSLDGRARGSCMWATSSKPIFRWHGTSLTSRWVWFHFLYHPAPFSCLPCNFFYTYLALLFWGGSRSSWWSWRHQIVSPLQDSDSNGNCPTFYRSSLLLNLLPEKERVSLLGEPIMAALHSLGLTPM